MVRASPRVVGVLGYTGLATHIHYGGILMGTTHRLHAAAIAILLAGHATADDTVGSTVLVTMDAPLTFSAWGDLILRDTDLNGLNNGPGEDLIPTTFLPIAGTAGHWSFDLWMTVEDWDMPVQPGVIDGAHNTQFGIRGFHHTAPHLNENPDNFLPPLLGGEIIAGVPTPADIRFGSGALLAVSGTVSHGDHADWYGAKSNPFAYDPNIFPYDATDPTELRHMRSAFWLEARHPEYDDSNTAIDHSTLGSTPLQGSLCMFDPLTRMLTVNMGGVDLLDTQGGRSGTITPEFAGDPLLAATPQTLLFEYLGYDSAQDAYLFQGGPMLISAADAPVTIGGRLGIVHMTPTVPGELSAYIAPFSMLWVNDTTNPDEPASVWARHFVDTGWFGQHLTDEQHDALIYPVLSWSVDIDLIEATNGFTQPAEVPATVLLSILTNPDTTGCQADLNSDGALDFFDVLRFLELFTEGSPQADFTGEGEIDFFDVLSFLDQFAAGCLD